MITLKPGYDASDALAADILAFAREHLAGFKVPRSVDFVDELPRSPAGKIQRKKVRDALLGGPRAADLSRGGVAARGRWPLVRRRCGPAAW